jgi:flagellar biosynthesis/type III secretory pathway protein FliH
MSIQPVSQKLFHVSADRRAHELYEARLKYSLDRSSDLACAKQEGFALGEQRGLLLGKQEGLLLGKQEGLRLGKQEGLRLGERNRALAIAHNLHTAKFPLSQIAEMTGLSISELSAEFNSFN